MTITSTMEMQEDIILEEVSKIFRCKQCLRCFLSFDKYAEHFPKYHQNEKNNVILSATGTNQRPTEVQQHDPDVGQSNNNGRKKIVRKIESIPHKPTGCSESSKCARDNEKAAADDGAISSDNEIQQILNQNILSPTSTLHERGSAEKANDRLEPSPILPGSPLTTTKEENESLESVGSNSTVMLQTTVCPQETKTRRPINQEAHASENSTEKAFSSNSKNSVMMKHEINCKQEELLNTTAILDDPDQEHSSQNQDGNKPIIDLDFDMLPLEKNYRCEYCDRSFTRERTLQGHMKTAHKKELEREKRKKSKKDKIPTGSVKRPAEKPSSEVKTKRVKGDDAVKATEQEQEILLTFSCKWCPQRFLTILDLKSHAVNVHIKEKADKM